jgi:hypothetical protein
MSATSRKRERTNEAECRLERAKRAAETIAEQDDRVESQLSLVGKLTEGWRRVHQRNHLAELFQQEYGGTK